LFIIDKVADPGGTVIVYEIGDQVVNHVFSLGEFVKEIFVIPFFKRGS
jgi:hypothetical protein